MFETPILFVIYNRPDKTDKVFNAIKAIKPKNLFVAADGPKTENDLERCMQARAIIDNIDWDCNLHKIFRDTNVGSKLNVTQAINWLFESFEQAIILEDDCVPNKSFFFFCSQLLDYYKDNTDVMHITGANLNTNNLPELYTYHYSRYPNIWGWATWKRAWLNYEVELNDKNYFKTLIRKRFRDPFERRFWTTVLNSLDKLDAWDYQWMFAIWKKQGICLNTNINFISNIGFDNSATHTKYDSLNSNLPTHEITTIIHPNSIKIDRIAEDELLFMLHNLKREGYLKYLKMRYKNLLHKIKLLVSIK